MMSEKEIDPLESGNGWIRYDHNTKKWVKSPENERLIKEIEGLKKCLRSASLDRDRYKEDAWHNDQEIERLKTAIREALKTFDSGVWMPIPSDTIKTILKKALEEEDGEL